MPHLMRSASVVVVCLCLAPATSVRAQTLEPGTVATGVQRGADADANEGRSLFRDIGTDVRALVTSRETQVILAVGLGGSLSLRPLDSQIATSRFNHEQHPSNALDRSFEAGEVIGGTAVQFGSAFALYGIGAMTHRQGVAELGRDLVRAQLLTSGMTQLLKYSVLRERPDGSSRASFPSGHSSGTFATAMVLHRRYGWKVGLPAFGVGSYVAASRLSENKHYLSDVVFGAAIGLAAGRTVTFDRGATRFSFMPMAAPGGVGVQVSVMRP